jgi:hypothetical protein
MDYGTMGTRPRGTRVDAYVRLTADPWETTNVVIDPGYARILARMRKEVENRYATTDRAPLYPIEPQ